MGLTERHWFENEEPELTERLLEDIVYENKKAYDNGYTKGFHDALKEHPQIVRCKDCKYAHKTYNGDCKYCDMFTDDDGNPIERYLPGDWFCADGERAENAR